MPRTAALTVTHCFIKGWCSEALPLSRMKKSYRENTRGSHSVKKILIHSFCWISPFKSLLKLLEEGKTTFWLKLLALLGCWLMSSLKQLPRFFSTADGQCRMKQVSCVSKVLLSFSGMKGAMCVFLGCTVCPTPTFPYLSSRLVPQILVMLCAFFLAWLPWSILIFLVYTLVYR